MTEYTIPMIIVGAIFFGFIIILFVGTFYNFKPNKNIKQNTIKQSQETVEPYEHMPYYLMHSVMTYHETILFSILSDFCQKYKFVLLSKVRLADFIQPINTTNRKDYYHWFNRISAKHVDFLVCETETIKPLCAIELDDYTHRYKNRQDRDEFVDNVYKSIKLPILHIYEVREKYVYQELAEALNIQPD